ncbi:hypothetical protein P154DRAFT_537796 [Amniculicola lignicola CBS 123094]|uniref:Uncharacterized protein n=1 Tax=Amniculicola lignicola CBS 123094 TaxID=1392246 RepID=A0A6A5W6L9_9PLEO|nr:hypothetical protein P154DRAFT_537796 [Amniculicola lignicola CBS 123094]
MLDHVRRQRSLFSDYRGRVKLAELRTDLGCLVGEDTTLQLEILPSNIRRLTLRCRSEVWAFKKADIEIREGNPLRKVLCDPITKVGEKFRQMFPDLHRITVETDELPREQLVDLVPFFAEKGVRFDFRKQWAILSSTSVARVPLPQPFTFTFTQQ